MEKKKEERKDELMRKYLDGKLTPDNKEEWNELTSLTEERMKERADSTGPAGPEKEEVIELTEEVPGGRSESPPEETKPEISGPEKREEEKKNGLKRVGIIAGIFFAILVLIGLGFWLGSAGTTKWQKEAATWKAEAQKARVTLAKAEAALAEAKAAPTAPVAPATPPVKVVVAKKVPEALKIAIVQKGEGIEHAFIRQLVANPSIVEGVKIKVLGKVYDITFKGDKGNTKELKKWAGWASHLIALNHGFVDFATGREVRVKVANNVAYLLQRDGDAVTTGEYEKDAGGNFKDSPTDTTQSLGDEMNLFKGNTSGIQAYEYVWKEG